MATSKKRKKKAEVMAEDGSISLAEGVEGALFTLPLDASKADPAAAEAFVESTGLEFIG